jgi:hypothetical protein
MSWLKGVERKQEIMVLEPTDFNNGLDVKEDRRMKAL